MTRRITGTFTDPCGGGVLSNIDIEFIAKQSSPAAGVPFGATCTFQTDGSGVYDQVIENGQYNIYYSQTENNRIKIGIAVVNDGADIDILNLIGAGGTFDSNFNLNLADLLDVDATNKEDGRVLVYRSVSGKHEYEDVGGSDYILIRDKKAPFAQGGTFISTAWRTRDLNTIVSDTGGHVLSLVGNQFELAAGTYVASIRAPAYRVNQNQAKLINITDTIEHLGSSNTAGSSNVTSSYSFIFARFEAAPGKFFEVQHFCNTNRGSDGFGAFGFSGSDEIYTEVALEKVD